jgi:hypothetical protein
MWSHNTWGIWECGSYRAQMLEEHGWVSWLAQSDEPWGIPGGGHNADNGLIWGNCATGNFLKVLEYWASTKYSTAWGI